MIKLILILSLISNICLADETEVHLNQNDKAPFSGSLFTDDKTQDI